MKNRQSAARLQVDISLVRRAHRWDIELNTRREIPFLLVPTYNSLYHLVSMQFLFINNIFHQNKTSLNMQYVFIIYWEKVLPMDVSFLSFIFQGCRGQLKVYNNIVESPGYPSNYPRNMDCYFWVPIKQGKALKIVFYDFILESHSSCR